MGVCVYVSTIPGGVTPTCNCCGVALCWDIAHEEYEAAKAFWDDWKCEDCNGGVAMSLKAWMAAQAASPPTGRQKR